MKKNIKIGIVIILLLIFGIGKFSIVIAATNTEFFAVNKEELSKNEMLEMTLYISNIKYDKFDFVLTSDLDVNNINISEDIKVENNDNNKLTINIDKSKVKLNKILFYYQIPEDIQIDSEIKLLAQIFIEKEINNSYNLNENNNINSELEYEEVENKEINVKIISNKQDENFKIEDIEKIENNISDIQNIEQNQNVQEKQENSNILSKNTEKTSVLFTSNNNETAALTQTAKYNGSNNNYLSSLEIEGETLNTTFNKENRTYFIETSSKINLNVIAKSEDSTAKVKVTGNSNLKIGENKILISVTAKNGDVRYYRVFVTNK